MHVTLCDYIMPWDSLSTTQKKSLSQRYEMGCECKVRQWRAVWAPSRQDEPQQQICIHSRLKVFLAFPKQTLNLTCLFVFLAEVSVNFIYPVLVLELEKLDLYY